MSGHSQFRLLRERRFGPFFATQFLGALNDNVLKNALVIAFTYQAGAWSARSAGELANIAQALFILPFFLFSAQAGQLADKFERSRIIRLVKLAEIAIMLVAVAGFATGSLALLLTALFLMGDRIRPGEVLDPAAAPARGRIGGWQRLGRERHLPRHLDRNHFGRRPGWLRRRENCGLRLCADRRRRLSRKPRRAAFTCAGARTAAGLEPAAGELAIG